MIAFIVATTIHEFCHAWTAYQLGDPTAARLGRVTLNPVAHFDPFGFIGMMMLAAGFTAIGWGKPVPVNTSMVRGHRRGLALTALAGPVSNIVLATLFVIPLRFNGDQLSGFAQLLIQRMVIVNLLLASFNFIPIPPLDGSKILAGILPNFWYSYMMKLEQYGFAILLLMFFLGGPLLTDMFRPVFNLLQARIAGTALY